MALPNSRGLYVGLLIGALVLVGAALKFGGIRDLRGPSASGLSAVFLTNNQVYFGKISGEDRDWIWLKNIYYIQKGSENTATSDVALMKLGNEVHGPEDMMQVSRQQILFIESLKPDGKMAKAIEAYQAK